jgi:hypothetical protein
MPDTKRQPDEGEQQPANEPQPDDETVKVDAGTSSAIHELDLEAAQEEAEAGEGAPANEPEHSTHH